ncbi:MAG: hypothetical protein V4530_12495 [Pseudomonadota bacterium]
MRLTTGSAHVALGCFLLMANAPAANAENNGTPSASSEPAPAASNKDETRKICRSLVITGSRMSKRFCRTQAQWDADEETTQRLFQQGQGSGGRRYGEEGATPR